MAKLSCLLVSTFGNFLAPVLVAAYAARKSDFSHDYLVAQHEKTERL